MLDVGDSKCVEGEARLRIDGVSCSAEQRNFSHTLRRVLRKRTG